MANRYDDYDDYDYRNEPPRAGGGGGGGYNDGYDQGYDDYYDDRGASPRSRQQPQQQYDDEYYDDRAPVSPTYAGPPPRNLSKKKYEDTTSPTARRNQFPDDYDDYDPPGTPSFQAPPRTGLSTTNRRAKSPPRESYYDEPAAPVERQNSRYDDGGRSAPSAGVSQKGRQGSTKQQRAPPGFTLENGVLIPNKPRNTSHPTNMFNQKPSKVVKALGDYVGQSVNELSFRKGDFFFVVYDDDKSRYFEVINPMQKQRGLVPREYFEDNEQINQRAVIRAQEDHVDLKPVNLSGSFFIPGVTPPSQPQAPPPVRGQPEIITPNQDGFYVPPSAQRQQPPQQPPPAMQPPPPMQPPKDSPRSPMSPPGRNNGPPPVTPASATTPRNAGPPSAGSTNAITKVILRSIEQRWDNGDVPSWWYTIDLVQPAGTSGGALPIPRIFRPHDEVWDMHLALLERFPAESGQQGRPRVIPFLRPLDGAWGEDVDLDPLPEGPDGDAILVKRRRLMACYMDELARVPASVWDSQILRRFFTLRRGDVDGGGNAHSGGEIADDLLPARGEGEGLVKIRVDVEDGGGVMAFRVYDDVSFNDLLFEVEDRLDTRIRGLFYHDELDTRVPLMGDEDLRLLLRTNPERLLFYPDW